jgi:hypothetical protein
MTIKTTYNLLQDEDSEMDDEFMSLVSQINYIEDEEDVNEMRVNEVNKAA